VLASVTGLFILCLWLLKRGAERRELPFKSGLSKRGAAKFKRKFKHHREMAYLGLAPFEARLKPASRLDPIPELNQQFINISEMIQAITGVERVRRGESPC